MKCRSGTHSEWLAVAEAAEAAARPDRTIDGRIALRRGRPFNVAPPYTASLDAITAALGPEMTWEVLSTGWARIEEPGRGLAGVAATPALALCAAFARAMADRDNPVAGARRASERRPGSGDRRAGRRDRSSCAKVAGAKNLRKSA